MNLVYTLAIQYILVQLRMEYVEFSRYGCNSAEFRPLKLLKSPNKIGWERKKLEVKLANFNFIVPDGNEFSLSQYSQSPTLGTS